MVLHKQKIPRYLERDTDVILEERPQLRVLFDETKEEGKWVNEDHSSFLLVLTSNNYTVDKLIRGPITYTTLKEFDIFVMGASSTAENIITPNELRSIGQFVHDGRGLLLIGNQYVGLEPDYNYALNSLFGLSFSDYVEDKVNNVSGDESAPLINLLIEHPITAHVNEVVLARFSSLKAAKKAEPLAFSNVDSKPSCMPMVGYSTHGKGRVVMLGGDLIFSNDKLKGIPARDNERLIANIFSWFPSWVSCPHCGTESPPSTAFCTKCRKPLFEAE